MKKISLAIDGARYKTKELDSDFVDFIENFLTNSNISLEDDNSVEKLFIAYLKLAKSYYKDEKAVKEILEEIENE